MKMKLAAALAATMAVGATCAFAANPFVDVPTDSWAYKSVVELAESGIIQGVDGTHFEGGRNITRYEAAEIVAKAMAHMDKASVEQRALINKLADEYADELNNLGVRVSALENKVGNVKLTGDARLRYRYQQDTKENDNSWDYRVRLRANAQVNDKTTVTYGLNSNNINFGSNTSASSGDDNIFTDIAKVDTTFGNFTASVGRTDAYTIGNGYGYQYGDVFDRAELKYNNGKFAVTGGYGKFKENTVTPDYFTDVQFDKLDDGTTVGTKNVYNLDDYGLNGMKTGYIQLEGFFGNGSAVGVYYNDFTGKEYTGTLTKDLDNTPKQDAQASKYFNLKGIAPDDLWGAYASINFGSKWNLLGDYQQISHVGSDVDDSDVWVGKLTYGQASMAAPKSWDIWVEYLDADPLSSYGSTNSWRFGQMDNLTSWGAGVDYTFAKNAMFSVMTSFASEAKDSGWGNDPEEQTVAQFVFAF